MIILYWYLPAFFCQYWRWFLLGSDELKVQVVWFHNIVVQIHMYMIYCQCKYKNKKKRKSKIFFFQVTCMDIPEITPWGQQQWLAGPYPMPDLKENSLGKTWETSLVLKDCQIILNKRNPFWILDPFLPWLSIWNTVQCLKDTLKHQGHQHCKVGTTWMLYREVKQSCIRPCSK